MNELSALNASGTKSDGGAGSEPASRAATSHGQQFGVAPGPSDPITSQPDEREAIAEVIWRAEYRLGVGVGNAFVWSDVPNNDRERYRFIAAAIRARGQV